MFLHKHSENIYKNYNLKQTSIIVQAQPRQEEIQV
jgi:hypothetical protein